MSYFTDHIPTSVSGFSVRGHLHSELNPANVPRTNLILPILGTSCQRTLRDSPKVGQMTAGALPSQYFILRKGKPLHSPRLGAT